MLSRERRLVPNVLDVALSPHDHERLAPYERTLTDDLAATTSDYAAGQGYVFPGEVRVRLVRDPDLATGRFRVTSRAEADEPGDRRRSRPPAPARARRPPGSAVPGSAVPGSAAPELSAGAETRTFAAAPAAPALPPRQTGRRTPFAELHVHGGERVPVEVPGAVIGRAVDADVRVDDPGASRRHAEIRIVWDGARYEFWLVDLESTNGTVVDGQRVPEARLANGSRITIGATTLLLRIDESRLTTG